MSQIPEPTVGQRIRSLRERDGLSLRALSERCGLSINAISQIERGENSPTVSSLHRLAGALNVPITDFFHDEEKQLAVFVKCNAGLQAQSEGITMESLGIGLHNQQLEPFRMLIEPGKGNGSDPISHSGEEFVYCLTGEVEYIVGDEVFHLTPGDSLLFEASLLHICRNPSENPATLLLTFNCPQDRHTAHQHHLEL